MLHFIFVDWLAASVAAMTAYIAAWTSLLSAALIFYNMYSLTASVSLLMLTPHIIILYL